MWTAGTDDLRATYEFFRTGSPRHRLRLPPRPSAPTAGKDAGGLESGSFRVVILLCFLHGWLKIRQRGKHLKAVFVKFPGESGAYHAADRHGFGQRLRSLRQWAGKNPASRPGKCPEPVWQARPLVDRLSSTAIGPATCSIA